MVRESMTDERMARWRVGTVLGMALTVIAALPAAIGTATAGEKTHGLSVFGDLKYPADFAHFDYADPGAVKGGSVTMTALGTFNSLNPFILKGTAAANSGGIYDTLTKKADDEPLSVYGLIAESMEVADDKRWVIFYLRPEARWHDGVALTAEDVVWTFDTVKAEGHPLYRSYYGAVVKAEALDSHTVKFHFSEGNNPELPLIIGELAILPKHFWEGRTFNEVTIEPLLGSGPYRFGRIVPGRSISYERVEDYWGKDLPVNVGRDNFDALTYEYYKDLTVAHEAFKAGEVDFKLEYISKNWKTAYDFPALKDGKVVQEEIPDSTIQSMQAFVFNTRKDKFSDPRVRRALGLVFDFEWLNKNLFYDAYQRTLSYFQGSEFMATGLPEGDELALLETYRDQLPESVFTEAYTLPVNDGSGNIRTQYRAALALLKEAGWQVKDGKLTHADTGEVMQIELLIRQPSVERIGLAFAKTLERIGVELNVRVVDTSQYEKRLEDFDFDLTTAIFAQSMSPGNEQADFWSSEAADTGGSRNIIGIRNPVVDALVKKITNVSSRAELVTTTRALDRVLLHGHYVIPQYHGAFYRVAYWNKFDRPATKPEFALGFDTWWVDPAKDAALGQ